MNWIQKNMGDIRFWIILFFFIRFYGITNPPLEIGHNWRQSTVTMAARNFLEINRNILYPRIDIAGEKTGITGMEFPLLNYIIYVQSVVFGYAHWYGRLINLIVSSFGIFYFFKLVKKYFSPEIAFNAAMILLFSIWFSYSRKIMPDTFGMSLTLIGMYYGSNYLDKTNRIKDLLIYSFFILAGTLSKISSAYIGSLFLFALFNRDIPVRIKLIFSATSALILSIVFVYYFYWVPYLVQTFGFEHFFMGIGISQGIHEIFSHLPETLEKFYAEALKYVGFLFFLAGIFLAFIKKEKFFLQVFFLGFLSFLFMVVFKSGFYFYHHIYYIIPFVPLMALTAAYAVSAIKNKKIALSVLAIIGIEGAANQLSDFRIKENYAALLNLEADMDKISQRQDLVLINSGDFPTPMYFAHRKGWVNSNEKIGDSGYIDILKSKGLKYIVILKRAFGDSMSMKLSPVISNVNYDIYRL
ncbi:MAG: glycosyltransferase family 39 protein [Bacteroidota bacterium]